MRFAFAGARPQPIDRNSIARVQNYDATAVAPHGLTTRWTYTVPTGKKAAVRSLWVAFIRQAVAAPAGEVWAIIGSGAGEPIWLFQNDNTAGATKSAAIGNAFELVAGETINGQTADASTGGNHRYSITAYLLEFDA